MTENDTKTLPRRAFLKASGLVGATAGVAAVALASKDASATAAMKADSTKRGDYSETEHVNTYYELARF